MLCIATSVEVKIVKKRSVDRERTCHYNISLHKCKCKDQQNIVDSGVKSTRLINLFMHQLDVWGSED